MIKQNPFISTIIRIFPFEDRAIIAILERASMGRVWDVPCLRSRMVTLLPTGERRRLLSSFVNKTFPVLWTEPQRFEN